MRQVKIMVFAMLAYAIIMPLEYALAYNLRGAGGISCSEYLEDIENDETQTVLMVDSWVLGFVSGSDGMVNPDARTGFSHLIDNKTVIAGIVKFCETDPTAKIANAAEAAVNTLQHLKPPQMWGHPKQHKPPLRLPQGNPL